MTFFSDSEYFSCNCSNSPYIEKSHGHVVTGDLQIIENCKLHDFFCTEPKYMEPTSKSFYNGKNPFRNFFLFIGVFMNV